MYLSLYISLALICFVLLSMNVIAGRQKYKTALLDGGHIPLRQRIRAQGNFAEYTPFFLIALGMAEYQGLGALWIHVLGIVFFVGRGLHTYSLLRAEHYEGEKLITHINFRKAGMVITFTCLLTLAVILIAQ